MSIVLSVLAGIVVLFVLILLLRLPAFIALLIASITTGLLGGLDGQAMMDTVKEGMGSTLGFIAVVVGLGAMFGAVLEKSRGAEAIGVWLNKLMGVKNAPSAMLITGFVVAIPVFFDVAFIILAPVIYGLQRKTNHSLLYFGIPLLAGLAITHAFIPPTPGPVAVADILKADLGWVILVGIVAGIPTAIVSGLFFGRYIAKKIFITAPSEKTENVEIPNIPLPGILLVLSIIFVPIILIICGTMVGSGFLQVDSEELRDMILLLGHPFSALIIANLLVWYVLGRGSGFSSKALGVISAKSFSAAGSIILLTGAGGAFKQVLVNTGAGKLIATSFAEWGLPVVVFGFLAAAIVRILQGSATVAMITAAGLLAPIVMEHTFSEGQLASLVIAIAAGASILSHANDSGFWLVKEYLLLDEKQTFRSWTVMTTILALTGFAMASLLFYLF